MLCVFRMISDIKPYNNRHEQTNLLYCFVMRSFCVLFIDVVIPQSQYPVQHVANSSSVI